MISIFGQSPRLYFIMFAVQPEDTRCLSPIALPQVFVANCIAAIQAGSDPAQWRKVPTAQNPADVVSRRALPSQVGVHRLWFV